MKQFRFKLQAVLDYRIEQLNLVQQRIAEEEQKRLQIQNRIRECDAFIEHTFREQQRALTETILDPMKLQAFPDYIWRLKQQRFHEYQSLQMQDARLQKVREELKQALIKKKSLEILKDKDYTRYKKQMDKIEEEFLSEIALTRSRTNRTSA